MMLMAKFEFWFARFGTLDADVRGDEDYGDMGRPDWDIYCLMSSSICGAFSRNSRRITF